MVSERAVLKKGEVSGIDISLEACCLLARKTGKQAVYTVHHAFDLSLASMKGVPLPACLYGSHTVKWNPSCYCFHLESCFLVLAP